MPYRKWKFGEFDDGENFVILPATFVPSMFIETKDEEVPFVKIKKGWQFFYDKTNQADDDLLERLSEEEALKIARELISVFEQYASRIMQKSDRNKGDGLTFKW